MFVTVCGQEQWLNELLLVATIATNICSPRFKLAKQNNVVEL